MLREKLISIKKRVTSLCYPFFVFPLFISLLICSNVYSAELIKAKLEEVRTIANNGAASLALTLIDEYQAALDPDKELNTWIEWEQERLDIFESAKRWSTLQQRVSNYKINLPADFYNQAKMKQIDALLKLKQGKNARAVLLPLIWLDQETADNQSTDTATTDSSLSSQEKWLPIWQKRVIRSYLTEHDTTDALLAAQRYYQDYKSNEIDDRLLRARILLMNQREDEVVGLLKKDTKHPQGGMLYLLAQLRSASRPPKKVLQSARRQMRGKWATDELRFMLWAVAAEAARASGDRPSTVNALEFVLAGHKTADLPAGLFNFSAQTLWNAYLDYALYLGNRAQFLVGDDPKWLKAAKRAESKYPVKARSLYTLVMLRGQSEEARNTAAQGFLELMHKRKRGASLMKKLFLNSAQYNSLDLIPAPIRYDLVDVALSRSDIELASSLMTTIHTSAKGKHGFLWQLRRARILVLGGKAENAKQALVDLINKSKSFNQKELERLIQVIFDFQTVKEHGIAYQLFNTLLPKVDDLQQQREIYFWMADSMKAQLKYTVAAKLYLRSAIHQGNNGLDPWGQTARYQTAEMLTSANLLKDAHVMLENLLRVTKEPARRAVLKHDLQKVWLLDNHESAESEKKKLNPEKVQLNQAAEVSQTEAY